MRRPAIIVVAITMLAACSPGPASSVAPLPAGSSAAPAIASRTAPTGAAAPVDPASWALADRLTSATYTPDTTAALIAGLARSGIATFSDPASSIPEQPVGTAASPFELLDFQTHALAVGAWAGSTWSGAELDAVLPVPKGLPDAAPASVLLASYVAAVDSPGAAPSRALMAGQDLAQPSTLRFPGVVLVLFVSDLATNGGHAASPGTGAGPAGSRETAESAQLAMAGGHSRAGEPILPAIELGSICSATGNWLQGMLNRVFDALKLATPSNVFGAIFATVWNYAVDRLQSLVQGVITTVTDAVLGSIRSVAGAIAAAADQVASILPYAVRVVATGGAAGSAFVLDFSRHQGVFTASVTAGDLPAWPAALLDCASVAGIALPDFTARNVPLTWGTLQAPGDPLISPLDSATPNGVTDGAGQATWGFLTSVDPGDPTGQKITQVDGMPVAIHRPELDRLQDKLTAALLGPIPAILRPFLADLIAPAFDGLQARLNKVLHARGMGAVALIYHDHASPKPSAARPAPSGACGPTVAAGTYGGTTSADFNDTINVGDPGSGIVSSAKGSGTVTMVIATDGTVSGTWDLTWTQIFDEQVSVGGISSKKDHRVATYQDSNGVLTGDVCSLALTGGSLTTLSCVDSLKGDCSSEPAPPSQNIPNLGRPTSVIGDTVTWTSVFAEDGSNAHSTFTLTVSRQ